MTELEELKKQVEELNKKIEELENKKDKRWRVEKGKYYYFINSYCEIDKSSEFYHEEDNYRYKTRNYFKTGEEAEKHLEKINTYYELMDLAEELNDGKEINWDDKQYKYHIFMCHGELITGYNENTKELGQVYCLDEDFLEKAEERIGENRLLKLFE